MYFSDPHRELGDLGFEVVAPSRRLQDVVQSYWSVRARLDAPRVERLYPDGGWGLSFNLGDAPLSTDVMGAEASLYGVTSRRRELVLAGRVDLIGVRFRPGAAAALTEGVVPTVRDRLVPLDDLGGVVARVGATLAEQLVDATSTAGRVALVERLLLGGSGDAAERLRPPDLVAAAQALLQRSGGGVRIDELAQRLGVSARQLERAYRAHVGLPPKALARLMRMRRARLAVKLAPQRPLADIAVDAGYFDQAHFTRDFRSLVGTTPGRYRRRAADRLDRAADLASVALAS
ncbi:MAG: helix-turn-helix domain-containing protein [Acidobacteriota bacterium]